MNYGTKRLGFVLAVLVGLFAAPSLCWGQYDQYDIFVRIDGIPGESRDQFHHDWVDALGFGDGLEVAAGAVAGGGEAVHASFADIKIIKSLDRASPILRSYAASGRHLRAVTIEFILKNPSRNVKFRLALGEVQVSGVSLTASDHTQEIVTFRFGRIIWYYYLINPATGESAGEVRAGWDLLMNKPI